MAGWKQKLVGLQLGFADPGRERLPCLFGDLKLNRTVSFLLQNDRARRYSVAPSHITDAQPDEVTGAQFAVDRQVKKGQFTCAIGQLKADPDRPNLFQLQRRFLADQFALVPGSVAILVFSFGFLSA